MSDVLQAAVKYQSRLKSELIKINDFVRMAEEFAKKGEPKSETSDSIMFFKTSPSSDSNPASQKETAADGPRSVSSGAGAA
jgi:hypothetical protein